MTRLHAPAAGAATHAGVVVAALAALLLTACSSDGKGGDTGKVATLQKSDNAAAAVSSTSSAAASEDPSKQLAEFATCMRKNGVDMPDPEVSTDGKVEMRSGKSDQLAQAKDPKVDADFEKAHKACQKYMPKMGAQMDPAKQAEMQDAMLKFTACMRAEGVDMPDPEFNGGGAAIMRGSGPGKRDDAKFEAAEKVCRKHLADLKGPLAGGGS